MATKTPTRRPALAGTVARVAPSYEARIQPLHSHAETANKQLSALSGDGWEIKAVVLEGPRHVVYLQRPKQRDPAA